MAVTLGSDNLIKHILVVILIRVLDPDREGNEPSSVWQHFLHSVIVVPQEAGYE